MVLNTKRAVAIAKGWVAENFASEEITEMGLEEVKFSEGHWYITVGFARPWTRQEPHSPLGLPLANSRVYKVVVVDDRSGEVVELRNREAA